MTENQRGIGQFPTKPTPWTTVIATPTPGLVTGKRGDRT